MANEQFIRVKLGDLENLHKLTDKVHEKIDENQGKLIDVDSRLRALESGEGGAFSAEDLREVRGAIETQNGNLESMRERLDALDKILPRGEKIYTSPGAKDAGERAAAARREFAHLILDQGLIARRARPRFSRYHREQTETGQGPTSTAATDTEGGVLLEEEFRPEIIRLVENYGAARRFCRVLPMASKDMRLPTNQVLPTVYWESSLSTGGQPTPELTAPSESGVAFDDVTMSAKKLIAIDTLSIELIEDSVPVVEDFIVDLFALAFAKAEDEQCFTAPSGSGPFTDGGLLKESGIAEVVAATATYDKNFWSGTDHGTGAYAKLLEMYDKCDESASESGIFVMSNSMINGLRLVRDTTGQPLTVSMMDPMGSQLFGRPILRSRVMPKMTDDNTDDAQADSAFLLYGDGRYKLMGDRRMLSVNVSEHAAFKQFGLVLRVVERVAFKTILKGPFSRLATTSA